MRRIRRDTKGLSMNIESEIRNLNRDLMEEYDSLDKKKSRE
jgi:hypothetical protein